jgi:hypothetical protein
MKNKKRYSIIFTLALLMGLVSAATAIPGKDVPVTYEGGRVTASYADISLVCFLEALSQLANLDVIVIETIDPTRRIHAEFNQVPLHTVLNSVLKGYNYAVVTNDPLSGRFSVFSYNHVARVATGKLPGLQSGSVGKPAAGAYRKGIETIIEDLEHQIASGAADREYEKWSRIRGEQFAVNAREQLARYRQQLDEQHDQAFD